MTLYRGVIKQFTPNGLMVEIPSLGVGQQFGPCEALGSGSYEIEQTVLCETVGPVKEDIVVLGPLSGAIQEDVVSGGDIGEQEPDGGDISMDQPAPISVSGSWDYKPYTWAHRGGADVVPENSYEGCQYAFDHGFPIEIDVKFLVDGTPVACHDNTVDRTMINITPGAVASKTQAEWRAATIKPAVLGGKPGRPLFFEEYLDLFGGRILLTPQIDGPLANLQACLDMIKARGLQKSVVVQAFSYANAQLAADNGCRALYLYGTENPSGGRTYQSIANDGIEFVGPGLGNATPTAVANAKAAGLKVIGYTVNTPEDMDNAINVIGCDGVFSDDPLWTSGRILKAASPPVFDGFKIPGLQHVGTQPDFMYGTPTMYPGGYGLSGKMNNGVIVGAGSQHLTCPWAGKIRLPFTIAGTAHIHHDPTRSATGAGTIGFTLLNRSITEFVDGASPGQEGWTFGFRPRGEVDAWEYVNGAAASPVINTVATPPIFAESPNGIGRIGFHVTITATTFEVLWDRNMVEPRYLSGTHNLSSLTQEYQLGLRFGGILGHFTDLRIQSD